MGYPVSRVPWYLSLFFVENYIGRKLEKKGYFQNFSHPDWNWWEITDLGRDAIWLYENHETVWFYRDDSTIELVYE
jgi:hypothetical protein